MALVNQSESRNFSAVSAVNISEGTGTPVMFMNASYNGKDVNFSKNIQNLALYRENQETVDADYEQFQNYVLADIGE